MSMIPDQEQVERLIELALKEASEHDAEIKEKHSKIPKNELLLDLSFTRTPLLDSNPIANTYPGELLFVKKSAMTRPWFYKTWPAFVTRWWKYGLDVRTLKAVDPDSEPPPAERFQMFDPATSCNLDCPTAEEIAEANREARKQAGK